MDVVFPYDPAHAMHSHLLFFGIHLQCDTDRFGSLVDIVWIHQQSVAKFASRSGELAENQHSAFVATCR